MSVSDFLDRQQGNEYKKYAVVAICSLLVLLCGSFIFYKERMLFSDAPHVLFRIINEGKLQIAEKRYGSFITQLFPYIGVQLHLSLKTLTLLYSVSFNIFFLTAGLLFTYRYKRYDLSILLSFYLILFVSDTYYWTNNEVHQGITWLFLAFAVTHYMSIKKRQLAITLPVFVILFALAIWTHPLVMLIALFLWFFYIIDNSQPLPRKDTIIYSVVLITLSFMKFYQGLHHGYDSGKIELVTQIKPERLKTIFASQQLHFFAKSCLTHYKILVLLTITGITTLIIKKKYILAAYTAAGITGYLLLLCITYWDVNSLRFYMESEYMPLSIICCAPFVYYTLPQLKVKIGMVILICIFVMRLNNIQISSKLFADRVTLLQTIDRKMKDRNINKLIITHADAELNNELIMNWGTPVESIILTQLSQQTPQRTFICLDDQQLKTFNTSSKDTLLGCFEKIPVNHINAYYFRIDTSTRYTTIDFEQLMRQ